MKIPPFLKQARRQATSREEKLKPIRTHLANMARSYHGAAKLHQMMGMNGQRLEDRARTCAIGVLSMPSIHLN